MVRSRFSSRIDGALEALPCVGAQVVFLGRLGLFGSLGFHRPPYSPEGRGSLCQRRPVGPYLPIVAYYVKVIIPLI
jgi:hypothetical protein